MIFEKVKEIIIEQLGVDEDTVTADANIKDLTVDSLEVYDIISSLEEECDLTIPEEAGDEIITVSDIVNYIEKNVDAD